MPVAEQYQINFGNGVNAVAPPHLVGDDEVQTATNIDFSLERGAAMCRRGSTRLHTVSTNTTTVKQIYRNYFNSIQSSPYYVSHANNIYRGVSGVFTAIQTGGAGDVSGFSSYRQHAFIAVTAGSNGIKDDGTTVTEWIKQAPATAPAITINTLAALSVTSTHTVVEGTLVGTNTNTPQVTVDGTTFRAEIKSILSATNLDLNGTNTIGDYGIHHLSIKFSNPSAVIKVSRDYSIGGTTFENYYHTEMDLEISEVEDALPDVDVLIDSQLSVGTSSDNVDSSTRDDMTTGARRNIRAPKTRVSAAKNVFNVWSVPRTKFELISKTSNPAGWTNIGAVRVVVEADSSCDVTIQDWEIRGAQNFPLNDPDLGYAWWETWAVVENGEITSESAPSPPSIRQKMQQANASVASASGSPTGTNPAHGLTHRVFYRQGGYLEDAYAVSTVALATSTVTDNITDIQALSARNRMPRNIHSKATFHNNIVAISEPFYDRLFVGFTNKIAWSLPARPDTFPETSIASVSHTGDEVYGFISWAPTLVIINRDSVYEMQGTEFEGLNANYVIQKTGSRHGTKAPKAIIKTPYGIPLIDYDGISMYQPGQGVDIQLDWAMEKIADTFRDVGATNPAGLKGDRIPALNFGKIRDISAAYMDGKLYLAMPCGSAQATANYVFALDFRTKQVQVYKYPFDIACLFWDQEGTVLLAGTYDGKIMQIEKGTQDSDTAGVASNITFSVTSRAWTAPTDSVLENIAVEYKGGTSTVLGLYDGTATVTIGTLTNSTKDWLIPALSGTVANNVAFKVNGTQGSGQSCGIYAVNFDVLTEPKRVTFWKDDYEIKQHDPEKLWDVHYADLEIISGNVLGTVFVEGTAVMTHTVVGPTIGRFISVKSFPPEIYGKVAWTEYRASGAGAVFKHWKTTYDGRPEPPRVNNWRTDIQSLDENICDAIDMDINPNGTVTGFANVDNTNTLTFSVVGTNRQSYTFALPNEVYGRTIYGSYTGTAFKHYQTWFHLRSEPDRWTNFVTDRESGNEQWIHTFECDVNPLGNTVLATVMVDNTAVQTSTITGTNSRLSYVFSLPAKTYGRTRWVVYNVNTGGRFKHYRTWFEGTDEPDRVRLAQTPAITFPSDSYVRTWVPELNPLGTCTGILQLNDVAINTTTFIGTERQQFNVGLDVDSFMALQTGGRLWAIYTGTNTLKHYNTEFEVSAKPFGKKTWSITYNKVGGASQLDMARFWSFDIEVPSGTATFTSIWDIDGTATLTNTYTHTSGRRWQDRISFPPGCRGYLFQQRFLSSTDVRVWKSNLDMQRTGVKGLSRATVPGTPS